MHNRREYIQERLRDYSPVVVLSCDRGILLFTVSSHARKNYEIYDRIAFGGMGHPADVERIRLMAIDLAHLEGFTRSPQDVTLQRLVNFGICPAVKHAFELIHEAPFVFRCIFAELGETSRGNLFCRVDYDGSSGFNMASADASGAPFAVVGSTPASEDEMHEFLADRIRSINHSVEEAALLAAQAWTAGMDAVRRSAFEEPDYDVANLKRKWKEFQTRGSIQIMLLDRELKSECKCRLAAPDETKSWLKTWIS
jgi:proteasome alpha subunit